ncbi:hypothetical protein [Streptomyces guryensis]|uniref:Secreted protein n=1 Tax=Streptomyces guryensis TaxID=2886947 RepID=A0A9Q3VNT2_9ACTN|nr:hypothetical protein [Streptomyces guryensis]MCD9875716.1 hypothetical protein [Streptomyces guryensis]
MRKPRKTVVVAVLLGTVGFLGAGTAYAHGDGQKHGHGHAREHHGRESQTIRVNQSTTCTVTEDNSDVQGETAAFGPDGRPDTQNTNVGSSLGCNNTVSFGK